MCKIVHKVHNPPSALFTLQMGTIWTLKQIVNKSLTISLEVYLFASKTDMLLLKAVSAVLTQTVWAYAATLCIIRGFTIDTFALLLFVSQL